MADRYLDPVRRLHATENTNHYVPFGRAKARSLIEGFFPQDETATIKMLLLDCADLRHILYTSAASRPGQKIDFHLSNVSKSVMARNVFILHTITSSNFKPESKRDLSFVWDVWYNLQWGQNTKERFLEILSDLEANDNWKQCFPTPRDVEAVCSVFQFWKSKIASSNKNIVDDTLKIRKQRFSESLGPLASLDKYSAARGVAWYVGPDVTLHPGMAKLADTFLTTADKFYNNGTLNVGDEVAVCCLNPTLFQPQCFSWDVNPLTTPLHSFYPISDKELSENPNIVEYCVSVLGCRIAALRKMLEEQRVKINFYVEDAIRFCWEKRGAPYDVVDAGNLADDAGLANLLMFTPNLLRDHSSLLLTETLSVKKIHTNKAYLAAVLGVPAELIPAVFGIRLLDNLVLGNETPYRREGRFSLTFCWALPPVSTSPKPLLDVLQNSDFKVCIDNLRKKCFDLDGHGDILDCYYTPLTLGLILRSMTTRFNFDLRTLLKRVKIPIAFKTSWEILTHWLCGGKLIEVSRERMNTCCGFDYDGRFSSLSVRPRMLYRRTPPPSDPLNVETLRMEAIMTGESVQHFRVSFLVPDGPDFGQFLRGWVEVYDVKGQSHLAKMTDVRQFTRKKFTGKLPELVDPSSGIVSPHPDFEIVSFVEHEEDYRLVLKLKKTFNALEGLEITANRVFPCLTAHEVRITAAEPGTPPLVMTFACPVLVDDVEQTFVPREKTCTVLFKKEFYMPWPEDYEKAARNTNKVDLNSLTALSTRPSLLLLKKHAEKQFVDPSEEHYVQPYVRIFKKRLLLAEVVEEIFKRVHGGKELLVVRASGQADPAFTFRVHTPLIRCNGQGVPLIAITAYDHQLAKKLVGQDTLDRQKALDDLREQGFETARADVLTVKQGAVEAFSILLRHNALLVEPSSEQKTKLLLETSSPWIVSYIIPIYADSYTMRHAARNAFAPFLNGFFAASEMFEDSDDSDESDDDDKDSCDNCGKRAMPGVSLKRCSRCRTSLYCDRQCQANDWPAHKKDCRSHK